MTTSMKPPRGTDTSQPYPIPVNPDAGWGIALVAVGSMILTYLLSMMLLRLTAEGPPDHVIWVMLLSAALGDTLLVGATWPLWHQLVLATRPSRRFRLEGTVRWGLRALLALIGAGLAVYGHRTFPQALPLLTLSGWQGLLAEEAARALALYGVFCSGLCLSRAVLALCLIVDLWRDEARQGTAPLGGSTGSTSQGHSP